MSGRRASARHLHQRGDHRYFPEDRCKVHVLAYDLTRSRTTKSRRRARISTTSWPTCAGRQIPHAIAHAYSAVNDKFTREHFEKLLLLFNTFEINGDQVREVNENLRRVLDTLTQVELDELAGRHKITPYGATPGRRR